MREKKLTPDEERAYRALARAARRLRMAQEKAERERQAATPSKAKQERGGR